MWIDLLMLLPVLVFLLWLFWYSAPAGQGGSMHWLDWLVAATALAGSLGVLAGLHAVLQIEGMGRNVMAVAASYLVLLGVLGLGWLRRWRR